MLSIYKRRPSSPAPKANKGLVKKKFYAEIAKSAKRPGFARSLSSALFASLSLHSPPYPSWISSAIYYSINPYFIFFDTVIDRERESF